MAYDAAGQHDRHAAARQTRRATSTLYYDAWNRLVEVTPAAENSTVVAEYQYDGANRRIVRNTYDSNGDLSETRHFYLSQQNQVLEERVGHFHQSPTSRTSGALRYVDDLVLRDRTATATIRTGDLGITGSRPRRALLRAARRQLERDGAGRRSGAVVERYTYTAYGKPEFRNADFTPKPPTPLRQYVWTVLYTGQDLDRETGLYFYDARYYSVYVGAFIVRDSIRIGQNLYEYCDDDPLILH